MTDLIFRLRVRADALRSEGMALLAKLEDDAADALEAMKPPPFNDDAWEGFELLHDFSEDEETKMLIEWALRVRSEFREKVIGK